MTSLDLPLDQIWNIYNSRADCENRIRELKQDFDLDAFCLQDFWATEASFRFIMVAYNLISLFRHFALNSRNQATQATLRSYCFAIGGWVSQHARKRVLKLSLPRKKRPWMDAIFSRIDTHHPLSPALSHNPGLSQPQQPSHLLHTSPRTFAFFLPSAQGGRR